MARPKVTGRQLKTKRKNPTTFNLGGKEYEVKLDFNVMSELEEVYGDISKAFTDLQKQKIKAIRALIYSIIKVEDENVTLKEVGSLLNTDFMAEFSAKMGIVLNDSMPEKTEEYEEAEEAKN